MRQDEIEKSLENIKARLEIIEDRVGLKKFYAKEKEIILRTDSDESQQQPVAKPEPKIGHTTAVDAIKALQSYAVETRLDNPLDISKPMPTEPAEEKPLDKPAAKPYIRKGKKTHNNETNA